jgi:putative glutamine amidotransferase
MRLVSAIWEDFHPFNLLPGVSDYHSTRDPEELRAGDVLITHGGEDISPSLYGQRASDYTYADNWPSHRDEIEVALMKKAASLSIPVIGICRGAQLLCALNGGILVQHVNGHSGQHKIETITGEVLTVNSIHHQMQYPWTGKCTYEMVAWAKRNLSDVYIGEDEEHLKVDHEPEFLYYPKVRGFGIQWHPEMMQGGSPATKFVLNFIRGKLCV